MSLYRNDLPQLGPQRLLTDGGLETTLIFHHGIELPLFASCDLLRDAAGTALLRLYYAQYAALAQSRGIGLVLEAPTWRANRDWGARLGYDDATLARLNRDAITLLADVRRHYATPQAPMPIGGVVGPRGDGYRVEARMSADDAERYHCEQVALFADTEADFVAAYTMTYADEAIGIVRAARNAALPVAISFTLETDGRLPSGESLAAAIARTDAATDSGAAYYMINCAHPTHLDDVLRDGGEWLQRIRGLRANASRRSHVELDASPDLDAGDPVELGQQYADLVQRLPQLTVLGGCCGTDFRHVEAICGAACAQAATSIRHVA
jgi:homocysteine S-methyltransferase